MGSFESIRFDVAEVAVDIGKCEVFITVVGEVTVTLEDDEDE
jgi:hypothetical protein